MSYRAENEFQALQTRSVKELKALARVYNADSKDFVEKAELIGQVQSLRQAERKTRLEEVKSVMDTIFGPFMGEEWKPKKYAEEKGRYLWTDAYAVCNFLTLFHETHDPSYLERAKILIQEVHNTLGKDRNGINRLGNSTDEEPLKGGLRIGKKDPEGTPDGDGQYFHYLTKWMFALYRMSQTTNDIKYNNWAITLAKAIHPHFVTKRDSKRPRMFWKLSIDLSTPLVPSEGNLDPFDGYITYRLLQNLSLEPDILKEEIADMKKIVDSKFQTYQSHDPLDLGEALWIAHWFQDETWAQQLMKISLSSLEDLWTGGEFHAPKNYRLAFREFGTTIGVQVAFPWDTAWIRRTHQLHTFWRPLLWIRDQDITGVMYCTSLLPGVVCAHYTI
jgi:hypothetical protein